MPRFSPIGAAWSAGRRALPRTASRGHHALPHRPCADLIIPLSLADAGSRLSASCRRATMAKLA
jgi:hypothetical protein